MKIPSSLAAVVIGFSAFQAHAESFGINFLGNTTDNVTGIAGVVPIGGWNNIANTTFNSGTVLSSDTLTSATLTLTGPGANLGWRAIGVTGNGGDSSLMNGIIDAGGQGGQANTGPGNKLVTMTLSGLTGSAYNLYVYTLSDGPKPGNIGDGLPEYTINGTDYFTAVLGGSFSGYVQGQTQSTELSSFPSTLVPGNYLLFSNVAPVGGTITITANNDNRTFRSPVNGFELTAVPEPSTYAMGAAAIVFCFVYRARRRARGLI